MESEDDMHDAESFDDDFYSGETAVESDDANAMDYEFMDNDSDDSDDVLSHRYQDEPGLSSNLSKVNKGPSDENAHCPVDRIGLLAARIGAVNRHKLFLVLPLR
ncbi:unnamed protein product [Ilex paraguariensis]|uniref:Uncharacterized protein n=1 Tax=Ilex paraguariensis TaxID=185542 RepID=A0ABC8RXQ9_9AQUA